MFVNILIEENKQLKKQNLIMQEFIQAIDNYVDSYFVDEMINEKRPWVGDLPSVLKKFQQRKLEE